MIFAYSLVLKRKDVAESAGFHVVPILENHIEDFERAANNDQQLGILSAYQQLSSSIDLINLVSDQLLEEWRENRPDIVIADFITLSGGLVANQLGIPWISTMATQFAIETTDGPPCFFGGHGKSQEWLASFSTIFRQKSNSFSETNCIFSAS